MKERREEIEIEIFLDDETFLAIAKMAHERDITFNKMVNYLLERELKGE
jgi:hypothetical protein